MLSTDRRGEPVLRDDSAVAAQLAVRDRRRHGGHHRGDGQELPPERDPLVLSSSILLVMSCHLMIDYATHESSSYSELCNFSCIIILPMYLKINCH